jgi:hypothetical protein
MTNFVVFMSAFLSSLKYQPPNKNRGRPWRAELGAAKLATDMTSRRKTL